MKKTYSISLEEDLMNKFTDLAKRLGTNKTNFLSMIITDVVRSEKITFYGYNKKQEVFEIEQEDFSKEELNSLVNSEESKKMEKLLSNIL